VCFSSYCYKFYVAIFIRQLLLSLLWLADLVCSCAAEFEALSATVPLYTNASAMRIFITTSKELVISASFIYLSDVPEGTELVISVLMQIYRWSTTAADSRSTLRCYFKCSREQ
jgi:hypothetical protein